MLLDLEAAREAKFEHFGLAICRTEVDQSHTGMLYTGANGQLMLLHLAHDRDLRNEEPKPKYKWVTTSLNKPRKKLFAVLCQRIGLMGALIPYGFDKTGIEIDRETGTVTCAIIGKGLTCSSFILIFLQAFGLRLLKESEWPVDENIVWQKKMVVQIEEREGSDIDHISALVADIGSRRFAPEEVVGASTYSPWPVSYEQATYLAILVMAEL